MQLVTVVLRDVTLHAEQIRVVLTLISPLIYAKSLGLITNSPLCAVTRGNARLMAALENTSQAHMTETTANPEIPEDVCNKCMNTCNINNGAEE